MKHQKRDARGRFVAAKPENGMRELRDFIALGFLYLGVGAGCHYLLYAEQFDWNAAATWGWLLAWPFVLLYKLAVFIATVVLYVVLAISACVVTALGVLLARREIKYRWENYVRSRHWKQERRAARKEPGTLPSWTKGKMVRDVEEC